MTNIPIAIRCLPALVAAHFLCIDYGALVLASLNFANEERLRQAEASNASLHALQLCSCLTDEQTGRQITAQVNYIYFRDTQPLLFFAAS